MTAHWSTACRDWERRVVARESLIPFKPLFASEADHALTVFKALKVVDLPGKPTFGEVCDQWVFDYVAAIFGANNPDTGEQLITEFFLLISKKNTKSTIAAGIMLTALVINWRADEELLILAPTIEVAQNSYKPAASMVRNDPDLEELFHVQDHLRTITHRVTKAALKVVAADTDTVSGKKSGRILIDELWVFGKRKGADTMLQEATGGMVSRPEGFVIYLSTQSDEPPAGVFKDKLNYARRVRDGEIEDCKFLPVIYEFPAAMVKNQTYENPANFYVTNPNLGRSVRQSWLEREFEKSQEASGGAQTFLAKHLNVEIGLNLRSDAWAGAEFWNERANGSLTLAEVISRSEVITVGIDGGGLDDLLGLAVLGREIGTGKWLLWSHAWAHEIVKQRRKEIAPRLDDFAGANELTFVKRPGDDVYELAAIVMEVEASGKLAEEAAVGVDSFGVTAIVGALTTESGGIAAERIVGIPQGWQLNGAIKTAERALAGGQMVHAGLALMDWSVGNAKVEPRGNAISITKQASGTAKIDPLMAALNAVVLMGRNPVASGGPSVYEDRGLLMV